MACPYISCKTIKTLKHKKIVAECNNKAREPFRDPPYTFYIYEIYTIENKRFSYYNIVSKQMKT